MEISGFLIQDLCFNWEIWGDLNKSTVYNGVGWNRESTEESTAQDYSPKTVLPTQRLKETKE